MASELSLSYQASLQKSGTSLQRGYSGSVNVAGRALAANSVLVTPAGLELNLEQVTAIGHVSIRHIADGSSADFVYVGQSGGPWSHKPAPGEWVEGRWNLSSVHVKTTSGQAWIEYAIISE